MPANLRPVPDSPQSTMTREMNENYARKIERYNSMPVLETSEELSGTRGTLIRLQVCCLLLYFSTSPISPSSNIMHLSFFGLRIASSHYAIWFEIRFACWVSSLNVE